MKKVLALIISCSIIMSLLPMAIYGATSPQDMVKKMGIGMNLGNTLEAPTEGSWSKAAQEYYFDDFKQAGFKHVRIPIRWEQHTLAGSPYTIDSKFLDRVETIVDWSLSRGFVTVINSHHDTWIMDNYSQNIVRFEKIWEQIAERFKGKSENLLFEILNEPHGNITDSQINDMNKRILNIIRKTNSTRNVIIGAGFWNSYNTLSLLEIPNDSNLVATFHYYDPYSFTHQWQGTWGTQSDMDAVVRTFEQVKSWSDKNNIPVYLGEFGVMAHSDRTSAVKWFDFISDEAISQGFACAAWDNGVFGSADNDMAFYNRVSRKFDEQILNAVLTTGTTYVRTTPTKTPPQPTRTPATPAVGEQVIDDFEGTMQWGAYSGVGATATCKASTGKSGKGLEITYEGSSGGYWGASNNRNEDWEKWLKIAFDIKSTNTNEVRLLISEQGLVEGEDGEHWTYVIKPDTSWTTIEIPFSSFTRRMDYQPPSQDWSETFDLYKVGAIHFMNYNSNSGVLSIDNVKLIGVTGAQTATPAKTPVLPTSTPTPITTPVPSSTTNPQVTNGNNLLVGAWVGTQPSESNINQFQQLQQRKLDIVHSFINWSTNFSFIKPMAEAASANGSVLMVTWEPWEYNSVDINNGKADAYITKMASDIKSFGKEIWLRPLHEANGNWYPWGIGYETGVNTSETVKAAFKHIVDIFRGQGVSNVKWIYNVNCSNVGTGTSFMGHYPGDGYVDYVSIDGYNWGTTQSWGSKWQSFDEIFAESYSAIKSTNKPVMIAEWASTEVGGDKASWITQSFNAIKSSYDKVFAVVWFNQNKETDWRVNSSQAALDAYIKAVAVNPSEYVIGDVNGDNAVNSIDFAVLRKFLLGIDNLSSSGSKAADVNHDGSVNSIDFALLRQYLLGIIKSF